MTEASPGRVHPWIAAFARAVVHPLVRVMHRARLDGVENLPASGPFLLVANHSAGLGLSEILAFLSLYLRAVGSSRPLAGYALAHVFRIPFVREFFRALGAIPSTYEAAAEALAAGVPILVFPGGSHETLRPIWQADRVDFGGHVGFLRVAMRAGVPIVPMGIRGAHFTAPILFRARWLATPLVLPRLLGQKRWALSLLGVLGALCIEWLAPFAWPWRLAAVYAWLASPLTFVPWVPWSIRFRIGAPIPSAALFGPSAREDDATLREALARVEGAVAALVLGTSGGGR